MPGGVPAAAGGLGTAQLSPIELDFLWESHGAGDLPYPLELRSHGDTMNERVEIRRKTTDELLRRGVLDTSGGLDPRLTECFEVLSGATISIDSVRVDRADDGRAVRAFAGALDGAGLLAVQDEQDLRLSDVAADGLASAIVGLLPAAARGAEKSITMPVEDLVPGAGADFLRRRGAPTTDADRKVLTRLHAQPRERGGQIGVNARTAGGGRTRSPVLSWFDIESGRYMTRATTSTDGSQWITIAPVDTGSLRRLVSQMVSGCVTAAR